MPFTPILRHATHLLLGLGISGIVVLGHLLLLARDQAQPVRTTLVNSSETAATGLRFRGVELELIGIGWFLLVIALALAGRCSDEAARARFRVHLFLASIVAVAWVLVVVLDVGLTRPQPAHYWFSAAIIGLVFVLTSSAAPMARVRDVLKGLPRDLFFFILRPATLLAVLCFVLIGAARPIPVNRGSGPLGEEFVAWFASQPRRDFPVAIPRSAVTIVKFNDYQCLACASADQYYAPVFDEFQKKYPGAVSLISYDFPVEAECNSAAPSGRHLGACEAAVAAKLAKKTGRGREMENWLYANIASLSRDTVFEAAKRFGIADLPARYDTVLSEVRAEAEVGRVLGVLGTPSYYVNGVMLRMVPSPEFRSAILHELRRAGIAERP